MSDQTRYESDMRDLIKSVSRLEAKIDTLGNVREIAIEAQQSASSAHKRIDKVDKVVFWAATSVIGGVIIAVLALLFKK